MFDAKKVLNSRLSKGQLRILDDIKAWLDANDPKPTGTKHNRSDAVRHLINKYVMPFMP